VTALYERHAVSMIRIALIMLGDRAAAEDVVQDAFFGRLTHRPRRSLSSVKTTTCR
jgi:DNA-directed RNA polymerase specialized sigma24 family protein